MAPGTGSSVIAAFVAGLPTLLAFFVWHWLTIAQVWTVLWEGLLFVAVAAAGVAWAWRLSRRRGRFASPWGGLAFGGVFAAGMVVAEVVGLLHGPQPSPEGAKDILMQLPYALVAPVLVTAAGVRLAGGWRGAASYGIASLVLLLYLGGSVTQRGGEALGLGLFTILFFGYLVAGALLAWMEPRIAARMAATDEAASAA